MKDNLQKDKSEKNAVHNIFQYYDKDFYAFIKSASRGNTNKKIRFKDKSVKIVTPHNAATIKAYIDNNGLMYKNNKAFFNTSSIIGYILYGNT